MLLIRLLATDVVDESRWSALENTALTGLLFLFVLSSIVSLPLPKSRAINAVDDARFSDLGRAEIGNGVDIDIGRDVGVLVRAIAAWKAFPSTDSISST